MKIIEYSNWTGRQQEVDIADAIEGSIDDTIEHNGIAETADRKANNCGKMLAKIVQCLHERKLLTDDNVKDMLSWKYTVED